MGDLFDPLNLVIRVPLVLLALTVHAFSHAYVAWRMGDPTAARLGRCTLNPIKHLDVLGTICLMFAPIGWAKPVPVNPLNFRDPRKGDLYTSAAGPASNLAQAIVFALLLRGLVYYSVHWAGPGDHPLAEAMWVMFSVGVIINVGLAVFNCLPIYPLDGFHITMQLVRPETQRRLMETAQYGPFLIIGLVLFGRVGSVDILGRLILSPANFLFKYVAGVHGLI